MNLFRKSPVLLSAGLKGKNCTVAFVQFSTRLLMRMSLLITFLTINLLLAAKETRSQDLDKVIISLNVKDATLKQVFNKIEKQTAFHFTYLTGDIKQVKMITYSQENVSLAKVLSELLQHTGLSYEQVDKNILIKQKGKTIAIITEEKNSLEGIIRGKITDADGKALNGATVLIKGTQNATTTNEQGNFVLNNVPDGNVTLVITSVVYSAKETRVSVSGGQSVAIDIKLSQESQALDEVVVIGYGTSKKKDLTGAVTSVNLNKVDEVPLTSVDQALTGRAGGVQINQSNGQAGAGTSIRIRCGNSLNGTNEPLFVIDGFPIINDNEAYALKDWKVMMTDNFAATATNDIFGGEFTSVINIGGKILLNYSCPILFQFSNNPSSTGFMSL